MFATSTVIGCAFAALMLGLVLGLALGRPGRLRGARGDDHRRALRLLAPTPRSPRDDRYAQQRDELFATLGHELRTPLRALIGLLSARATDVADEQERQEQARALAAHALRVAEDSLDFALLERGAPQLREDVFDLERLLSEVVVIVRPQRRGATRLQIDLAPQLPLSRLGDAARLRQVLVNLLGNALAYTEHGVVRLVAAPTHDGGLRLDVTDTGAGMTVVERSRAFQLFAQGERARGRAGIGLAVVARLVEAMGGRIELDSNAGLGTRFELTLPLPATDDANAAEALPGRSFPSYCEYADDAQLLAARLSELGASCDAFDSQHALATALDARSQTTEKVEAREPAVVDGVLVVADRLEPVLADALERCDAPVLVAATAEPERWLPTALCKALAAPARGAGALRVLVVDDHPVARRVLESCLTAQGATVTLAEDGAGAVELAEQTPERFDWVLLDRRMPGMDGLATAARLRLAPATAAARLALLVNDASDDPGAPELFDQVLLRPTEQDALAAMLRLAAPSVPAGGRATAEDPTLVALRDETLREDLAGLRRAIEDGDAEGAGAHLHRMEGALRVCPDETLRGALGELSARWRDADGSLERFARILAARDA